ncbi:hypothetical protein [Agrobacterium rosae]|uniref:Uncharacterized protein n=1 Tax=Agrobacterium rosae TaxID=1972867 RepID=A0A1R3U809_9HYPH|nr:hypothetical protein [Agrobacterium rosae]SCX35996.1 hypothetical protein DSM25559_5269 [Agrobacterium rosae]
MINPYTFLAVITFLFLPWMIVAGSLATPAAHVFMALAWFLIFGLSLWLSIREDAKRDRDVDQQNEDAKEFLAAIYVEYDAVLRGKK